LHDLESWSNLLIAERRRRGTGYPTVFARSLNTRIKRLQVNWAPELRYQEDRPYQAEVRTVLEASAWLLGHYKVL
jgi:hypothetical protein